MNLVITALGKEPRTFITEILQVMTHRHCNILEMRTSRLGKTAQAAYLLVEGNWNHLAKLENLLEGLEKRFDIQIQTVHTEIETATEKAYIPYRLDTISIDQNCITDDIVTFLCSHKIVIQEIKAHCYPALYSNTPLFATEFIVLIPNDIQLVSFRNEVLHFCDNFSLDAVFEPFRFN